MHKNIFSDIIGDKKNMYDEIRRGIIGVHKRRYFDYTASGLAYKVIEKRICEVLRTYANTHSKEAGMAEITELYYTQARLQLKSDLKLSSEFAILPSGCGATSAIKRLQEILGIYIPPATAKRFGIEGEPSKRPLVIVGPYEHHSNEVSYREALCDVVRIGVDAKGKVDMRHLEDVLKKNAQREIIGSFCIASNVTGMITPYEKISSVLRRYGAIVCFDAATSSPYMNVPSTLYDAMFLSPHKLIGGPGSCGILVIKKELIDQSIAPSFAGGGTFEYVGRSSHRFVSEKEVREEAGTPPILQFIKAALAYRLRNEIGLTWIKETKGRLLEYFLNALRDIEGCTLYGNTQEDGIGVVSFNVEGVDPYELCSYMSKKSRIQTRAGCSCAGPYGHDLLGIEGEPKEGERVGWLRVSIHFSHSFEDIDLLLSVLKKGVARLRTLKRLQ